MKKKVLVIFILYILFIPKVRAFSYDMVMRVDNTTVSAGTIKEIKVSLENVKNLVDSGSGIGYCSLNISFDNSILLDSKIRTLNSWTVTNGDMYVFDTIDFVIDKSDMFVIPVKINGVGSILLSNIVCTDGYTNERVEDKSISFSIAKPDPPANNNDKENIAPPASKSSNCDLASVSLSDGIITFDPSVTEYSLYVSDLDAFNITVTLADNKASYVIDKNVVENGNNYVITVTAEDGSTKVYTFEVMQKEILSNDTDDKTNYTPIFIGIIVVLVLINVFRIVKNIKK